MMSKYVTECGKACIEQAKKFDLLEFYDPFTGNYMIPDNVFEYDTKVKCRAIKLLKEGNCFDETGKILSSAKLYLSIEKVYGEESGVDGNYIYCIGEIND